MSRVDQVGGDHYRAEFQHWDWAAETQLGYLEGNASKYVSRWRKKNGVEDLKKALSYVMKLIGMHNQRPLVPAGYRPLMCRAQLRRFTSAAGLSVPDVEIIQIIDSWTTVDDLQRAAAAIQALIDNPGVDHPAPFGWSGEDGGRD